VDVLFGAAAPPGRQSNWVYNIAEMDQPRLLTGVMIAAAGQGTDARISPGLIFLYCRLPIAS
jgi:hypothetical protein